MKTNALLLLTLALNASVVHAGPNRGASGRIGVPALPSVAVPGESPGIPALGTPSLTNPAAAVPGAAVSPLSAVTQAAAPQISAIAAPQVTADGSAQAGQNLTAILQGGSAAQSAELAVSGSAGQPAAGGLSPQQPSGSGPAAPTPAPRRKVSSRYQYEVRRLALASIAAVHGLVYSLPQANARLTSQLLKDVAQKQAVLSDIDDTLSPYNTLLDSRTVKRVIALRRAGKFFAAVTDRRDYVPAGSSQMSAIESFSAIPVRERQGIVLATNAGGKIYEYDAKGQPRLIFEEPALPQEHVRIIEAAAEVVVAKLSSLDTGLIPGDEAQNYTPWAYSMILQAGTPEATVKQVAAMLEAEMRERGLSYEVEGRMAKNPAMPPYVTFSKLNKSLAVRRIQELKNLKTDETVLIGDSMYAPNKSENLVSAGNIVEIAERLSGGPMPLTGNATDRNMELGMPGAMTLSVGGTADPRMTNAFVLDGKGPSVTRRVLAAMAAQPAQSQQGE